MIDTVLGYITWNVDPDIITEPLRVRYYGICFVMGFILGYPVVKRIFRNEGVKEEVLDKLLMYAMFATIIGARLGHVLLYGPYHTPAGDGYFDDPIRIFYVWEGGLASHGGSVGLLIAMWLFAKNVSKKHILWGLDRLVIGTALAAGFIRLGNLFNSEIVGTESSLPWAFHFPLYEHPLTFVNDGEVAERTGKIITRHPTQLYETLAYWGIFAYLLFIYWKQEAGKHLGRMFGWFLTLVFGVRILVEFIKEHQAELDDHSLLNKGQLFSVPFFLAGLFFIWYARSPKRTIKYDNEMEGYMEEQTD